MRIVMTILNQSSKLSFDADTALTATVKGWVGVALIGQWAFAFYILSLYALPSLMGETGVTHQFLPGRGFINESTFTSILFLGHILPAAIMALSGLFQLFPTIRNNYPRFHRWNGRLFFSLGLSGALTGLYLTWGEGFRFSDAGSIGVTVNGLLILVAIFFAWKTAIQKRFATHQRFAVHSFLLVNAVWTFRLYLISWFVVNQGANGNTRTIDGPADITLSFASYLLPMLVAELYFAAKRSHSDRVKWGAVLVTTAGVAITLLGVISAIGMMWMPRLESVFFALF